MTVKAECEITLTRVDDGADGPAGSDGKSAYEAALEGGLPVTTTEQQFNDDLAQTPNKVDNETLADFEENVNYMISEKVGIGNSNIVDMADVMEFVDNGSAEDGLHIRAAAVDEEEIEHIFDAHISSKKMAFKQDGNETAYVGSEKFEAQEVKVKTKVQGGEDHLTIGPFRIGTHKVSHNGQTLTNLRFYYVGDE